MTGTAIGKDDRESPSARGAAERTGTTSTTSMGRPNVAGSEGRGGAVADMRIMTMSGMSGTRSGNMMMIGKTGVVGTSEFSVLVKGHFGSAASRRVLWAIGESIAKVQS